MIDFEFEIEQRLQQYHALNQRGNLKDSNRKLYEIIRLMMAMLRSRDQPVRGDHIMVNSAAMLSSERPTTAASDGPPAGFMADQPAATTSLETASETPSETPRKRVHAPHGLTRFGNPRRIRPRPKKPGPSA